jgi:phosphoglycerol transferase MdoB-like AlkP superfamily enzyme
MKRLSIPLPTIFAVLVITFYISVLQIEHGISHYRFHAASVSLFSEVWVVAVSQLDTILFSFVLLLAYRLLGQTTMANFIVCAINALLLLYVCFDHVFYTLYLDHIRIGFDPEGQSFDPSLLLDSLLSIVDSVFYFNLCLAAVLSFCSYLILVRKRAVSEVVLHPLGLKHGVVLGLMLSYLLISFFLKKAERKEFNNPVFVLIQSVFEKPFVASQHQTFNPDDLYTLRYGSSGEADAAIDEYVKARKNNPRRCNVIYVVLESVGAINLLEGNEVNKSIAPNLYAMRNSMVLFPDLHGFFPSTTRSHLPIISGGNSITYGSLAEVKQEYVAPTLVSEMKKAAYRTGIFTAQFMNFEELDTYYHLQKFEKEFMPETMPENYINAHKINSWGIDEKELVDALFQWASKKSDRPFFAEFMNVGTHHPYNTPKNYTGPFKGNDDRSRYGNAIHYTDHVLGQLFAKLKSAGLFENTIVCISGDHGEAFGDRHYGNYLHKNFLYEENIKNFLMIFDPQVSNGPVVSTKRGSIGDIMPSILSYVNVVEPSVFGQNLFAANYKSKIHYFSKSSFPEMWGLVDGQWKFIVQKIGNASPELYNLVEDPLEKNNLAAKYPARIEEYVQLLLNWYVIKNKEYVRHLKDYQDSPERELTISEVQHVGPKKLLFGFMNNGIFNQLELIHPKEKVYAWTPVVPFSDNMHLRYKWISPSGKIVESDFYYDKEWSVVWKKFERQGDMEEGSWECQILNGNDILIKNTFQVSAKALLKAEYFYEPGPINLFVGVKKENGFLNLEELNPKETVVAFSQINPYGMDKDLKYVWYSPSNVPYNYDVPYRAGWNYTWLILSDGKPMEEGIWKVMIYSGSKKLIETDFLISSRAKLHPPLPQ